MSKEHFDIGHSDGTNSGVIPPVIKDYVPSKSERIAQQQRGSKAAETTPITEEELAPSRKAFVKKGGELPTTGSSRSTKLKVTAPRTRGVLVPATIKTGQASAALIAIHNQMLSHHNELASHEGHADNVLNSLAAAKDSLTKAKAHIAEGDRLKRGERDDAGVLRTYPTDANKNYQKASKFLVSAHSHLTKGHVLDAATAKHVASSAPEQSHIEELHKQVHTLPIKKDSKPFNTLEFAGKTLTGEAIGELAKAAEEKAPGSRVQEKISRAASGTPRGRQLVRGEYANPKRKASRVARIAGTGGQAQRKLGRTPGFEGKPVTETPATAEDKARLTSDPNKKNPRQNRSGRGGAV